MVYLSVSGYHPHKSLYARNCLLYASTLKIIFQFFLFAQNLLRKSEKIYIETQPYLEHCKPKLGCLLKTESLSLTVTITPTPTRFG